MALISFSDPINDFEPTEEEDGSRRYKSEHLAIADTAGLDPNDVLADALVPVRHTTAAPWDSVATCRTRSAVPWEDNYSWFVTIEWSTKRDKDEEDEDPLSRPVTATLNCVDVEVPATVDARGFPMVNTAGKLYAETITANIYVYHVLARFDAHPGAFVLFNNTVNATNVSIWGVTYGPRTCWMKNFQCDDSPKEEGTVLYYEATYEIHVDLRGYWTMKPNTGQIYLEYQTRDDSSSPWEAVTYATWFAHADDDDRRIAERRNMDDMGNDAGEEAWLDPWGQKTRPTFPTAAVGTGAMTAGSANLTVTGGDFTDADKGGVLTFAATGPFSKPFSVVIVSVTSSTVVVINQVATSTFSGVNVTFSGCLFNLFLKQPSATWTSLPLPPTPPTI